MLFFEQSFGSDRPKGDAIAFVLYQQIVSGTETHLVAKGFGEDESTGTVDGNFGRHTTILQWRTPQCNAIYFGREPEG